MTPPVGTPATEAAPESSPTTTQSSKPKAFEYWANNTLYSNTPIHSITDLTFGGGGSTSVHSNMSNGSKQQQKLDSGSSSSSGTSRWRNPSKRTSAISVKSPPAAIQGDDETNDLNDVSFHQQLKDDDSSHHHVKATTSSVGVPGSPRRLKSPKSHGGPPISPKSQVDLNNSITLAPDSNMLEEEEEDVPGSGGRDILQASAHTCWTSTSGISASSHNNSWSSVQSTEQTQTPCSKMTKPDNIETTTPASRIRDRIHAFSRETAPPPIHNVVARVRQMSNATNPGNNPVRGTSFTSRNSCGKPQSSKTPELDDSGGSGGIAARGLPSALRTSGINKNMEAPGPVRGTSLTSRNGDASVPVRKTSSASRGGKQVSTEPTTVIPPPPAPLTGSRSTEVSTPNSIPSVRLRARRMFEKDESDAPLRSRADSADQAVPGKLNIGRKFGGVVDKGYDKEEEGEDILPPMEEKSSNKKAMQARWHCSAPNLSSLPPAFATIAASRTKVESVVDAIIAEDAEEIAEKTTLEQGTTRDRSESVEKEDSGSSESRPNSAPSRPRPTMKLKGVAPTMPTVAFNQKAKSPIFTEIRTIVPGPKSPKSMPRTISVSPKPQRGFVSPRPRATNLNNDGCRSPNLSPQRAKELQPHPVSPTTRSLISSSLKCRLSPKVGSPRERVLLAATMIPAIQPLASEDPDIPEYILEPEMPTEVFEEPVKLKGRVPNVSDHSDKSLQSTASDEGVESVQSISGPSDESVKSKVSIGAEGPVKIAKLKKKIPRQKSTGALKPKPSDLNTNGDSNEAAKSKKKQPRRKSTGALKPKQPVPAKSVKEIPDESDENDATLDKKDTTPDTNSDEPKSSTEMNEASKSKPKGKLTRVKSTGALKTKSRQQKNEDEIDEQSDSTAKPKKKMTRGRSIGALRPKRDQDGEKSGSDDADSKSKRKTKRGRSTGAMKPGTNAKEVAKSLKEKCKAEEPKSDATLGPEAQTKKKQEPSPDLGIQKKNISEEGNEKPKPSLKGITGKKTRARSPTSRIMRKKIIGNRGGGSNGGSSILNRLKGMLSSDGAEEEPEPDIQVSRKGILNPKVRAPKKIESIVTRPPGGADLVTKRRKQETIPKESKLEEFNIVSFGDNARGSSHHENSNSNKNDLFSISESESKANGAAAKPTSTCLSPVTASPIRNRGSQNPSVSNRNISVRDRNISASQRAKNISNISMIKPKQRRESSCLSALSASDLKDYTPPSFYKHPSDEKAIRSALHRSLVFDDLAEEDIDILVRAFEMTEYGCNEEIMRQGDRCSGFYVISKGKVKFDVDGKKTMSAGDGSSFGEQALLHSCPCVSTVTASSPNNRKTVLFRVDRTTFRFIMQSRTKLLEGEKMKLLSGVSFLQGLPGENLSTLCSAMIPRTFEPGDILLKKGDVGVSFFVINDGNMKITDHSAGSMKYEDIPLRPGDHFGANAIMTKHPQPSTVIGITTGTAYSIGSDIFLNVLKGHADAIFKSQSKRLLEGIKTLQDADIDDQMMRDLAGKIVEKTYRAKSDIVRQGIESSAALYFVREGIVTIKSKDGSKNQTIPAGGFFGEEQLLADSKSSSNRDATSCMIKSEYTATAASKCVCGMLTVLACRELIDTTKLGESLFGKLSEAMSDKLRMREVIQAHVALDDLERHSVLGEGLFGEVWLVTIDDKKVKSSSSGGSVDDKYMQTKYALKIQAKEHPLRNDAREAIKREMTVIKQLQHPFVSDLVSSYECDESIYMMMSMVPGGELWERIHREDDEGNWTSGMPEPDARFYSFVIADTLAYIHRQKFVFRDLKPENVLIDADGYPIIVDFGFAKHCVDKTYTFCGTPNYLAPEIVMNSGHAGGVDHWALGVVIYEMMAGENPFFYDGMDQMALFEAIVHEKFYPLAETISARAVSLIDGLLAKDPVERLGVLAGGEKDIVTHPWFNGMDLAAFRTKGVSAPFIPS